MKYDFTTLLDRRLMGSAKWDQLDAACITDYDPIIQPMGNAETDFPTLPAITEGLCEYIKNGGILSYYTKQGDYLKAMADWYARRHGWEFDPSTIATTNGVHGAVMCCVHAFTNPGDSIVVLTPVWPGFAMVAKNNGRGVVEVPLVNTNGIYTVDWEAFERACADEKVKLFFLCSPHNPCGRVWKREELERFAEICEKYDIIVAADEIHCDIIMPGHKHIPFASLSEKTAMRTVVCTAASKTFNLAGFHISQNVIKNDQLREAFVKTSRLYHCRSVGALSCKATELAFNNGDEWVDMQNKVIWESYRAFDNVLKTYSPEISVSPLEGSYLLWLDTRRRPVTLEELEQKGRIFIESGAEFGKGGEGFWRVNIACPTAAVEAAAMRLAKLVKE